MMYLHTTTLPFIVCLIYAKILSLTQGFTLAHRSTPCLAYNSPFSSSILRSVPIIVRGYQYGSPNSTIPSSSDAAKEVGVRAVLDAPKKKWKRAWVTFRTLLPILHLFDRFRTPESSLNRACLWWKAIAGNDEESPAFDNGLAYDILPPGTRIIVGRRVVRYYPRLHHANVEIRTAYLNR